MPKEKDDRYISYRSQNMTSNLWSQCGMPHRGWTYVDCVDSGGLDEECQFCGNSIRYVHYITHPEIAGQVGVGCVCAETLTRDYVRPKERHKAIAARAKRLNIPWRPSKQGYTAKYRDYRLTVFERESRWVAVVSKGESRKAYSPGSTDTVEEAYLLAEGLYRDMVRAERASR